MDNEPSDEEKIRVMREAWVRMGTEMQKVFDHFKNRKRLFMHKKQVAEVKDALLWRIARNNKDTTIEALSDHVKVDENVVISILQDFEILKLVNMQPIHTDKKYQEYFVSKTSRIYYFFNDHGFLDQYNAERTKYNWTQAKMIANVANAIVVIAIAVIACLIQFWDYDDKKEAAKTAKELSASREREKKLLVGVQTLRDSLRAVKATTKAKGQPVKK